MAGYLQQGSSAYGEAVVREKGQDETGQKSSSQLVGAEHRAQSR